MVISTYIHAFSKNGDNTKISNYHGNWIHKHINIIQACSLKMNKWKMCGPQIRLCLFTLWLIALKQLNSSTTINTFSWLGGPVVKHLTGAWEVPGSFPESGKVFMLLFFYCCCCFSLFLSTTHSCRNILYFFAMLFQ